MYNHKVFNKPIQEMAIQKIVEKDEAWYALNSSTEGVNVRVLYLGGENKHQFVKVFISRLVGYCPRCYFLKLNVKRRL